MPELLDIPAVDGLVVSELQGTHGVGDALDGIRLAVCVVVHGIDAPLVARALMRRVQDAVHDRIAHVQIRRRHVNLRAQHTHPVGEFALLHAGKKVEIFFDCAVAKRRVLAGLCQRAAVLANLVGGEVIDIGLACADELRVPTRRAGQSSRRHSRDAPIRSRASARRP